uniref:Uncharacterized protein n=1 Tax=Sinocyclocheilus grahami TaxID=75366 RepID=A0A672K6V6_SINGR
MPPLRGQTLNPNELKLATPPPVRLVKAGVPVCLPALFKTQLQKNGACVCLNFGTLSKTGVRRTLQKTFTLSRFSPQNKLERLMKMKRPQRGSGGH